MLVTGVFGFIGSHFARLVLERGHSVVGFGRDSNQHNRKRVDDFKDNQRFRLVLGDLCGSGVQELCEGVDVVVNFAAKTFVDYSVRAPEPFIQSNLVGTYHLLEEARRFNTRLFVQVSTDEVYGSILEGAHTEESPLRPGNPYSASKAAADMLALSYHNTYKLPVIITRTENNYGNFQNPQKLIPAFVKKALADQPLPLYGDGLHRRMWLHVKDHCLAILHLIEKGKPGEIYHVAAEEEVTNLDLTKRLLALLGKPESLISFIDDSMIRPGHDRRYAIDSSKLRATGWTQQYDFELGLHETVRWYYENQWWFA
jgi:dTDP-glucose 4,6-dehydratase